MKQKILQSIYHSFDSWASHIDIACHKGCTACCTQNVTITAIEGEHIIDFIKTNNLEQWFVQKLETDLPDSSPSMTTNGFADACLKKIDVDPGVGNFDKICPFLESGSCSIYDARPFSCRSFISTTTCKPGISAAVPQYFMSATTAVSQIIEHLGQKEYWGNMLHVLYVLTRQASIFGKADLPSAPAKLSFSQSSCLSAKPLPGFLISETDYPNVGPLLERIFDTEIEGKKIEDTLNNR